MQTYLKEKRNLRRAVGVSRRSGTYRQTPLESALLKIASLRFQAFRDRFGRDPYPDEPLFFDPTQDEPVAPESAEMRSQLLAAASATRSDHSSLLKHFGLE